jgi:hypothetical protein
MVINYQQRRFEMKVPNIAVLSLEENFRAAGVKNAGWVSTGPNTAAISVNGRNVIATKVGQRVVSGSVFRTAVAVAQTLNR